MRYTAPRHSVILQRAALGPAAVAARAQMIRHINLGLPQRAFVSADMMRRGGSLGGMGCCGLGALAVPPSVTIGPIAAQLINLRKSGVTPQAALVTVLAQLAAKGESVVTPAIHLQLAAGLQPMPSGLHGFLGALGLAPVGAAGMTGSTLAASTAGAGALATGATSIGLATGVGSLGAGIALGQTVIPFPVVGAVIGAVVFEAMHLLKRHVGKAEAAWANQGFYNSLRSMNGRDY
ncbi:MAG: hypothetical protein ACRETL_13390, partial [Gammaproteobacteria bacterium]